MGKHKPNASQRKYLERGLQEPGGKLPLFDLEGQRIDARTVQTCLDMGWAQAWFANPLKPDWLVCRLTDSGRDALAVDNTSKEPIEQKPEKKSRKKAGDAASGRSVTITMTTSSAVH